MSEAAVAYQFEPGPGHNNPPADADALTERLANDHADLLKRAGELEGALARVPAEIKDEPTANKAADFIKQLQAGIKNGEAARTKEKEPYLEGGRRVDGFFKTRIAEPLEAAKKTVSGRLTAYQRKVAEEERIRREEEERRAREEAARAQQDLERRIAALRDTAYEEWDDEALRKVYQSKVSAYLPESRAEIIAALRSADEAALESTIEAENAARRAAEDAAQAGRHADAKAADLTRTRSAHGSVASLRTIWTFRDLDRATLDLEALRSHLPQAALEQAVRSFVKAGGRELQGVTIYEDHESVVR